MSARYRAQFWAPYRGRVDVPFMHPADRGMSGEISADQLAAALVHTARSRFNAKWPLGSDPIHLVGIEDTMTGQRWGRGDIR